LNTYLVQGVFHFIQLKRLDYRFNFFHENSPP
jgi:hypothetical protein